MPRGTLHNFRNAAEPPSRILLGFAPGGMEGFFRESEGESAGPDGVHLVAHPDLEGPVVSSGQTLACGDRGFRRSRRYPLRPRWASVRGVYTCKQQR